MSGALVIRGLTIKDLESITAVHQSAFHGSALTELGPGAIKRYYTWQFIGPHDLVALGAFENRNLVGFCFGGVFRGAMGGFLRKYRTYLIMRVLTTPRLLTNPQFRNRLKLGAYLVLKKKKKSSLVQPNDSPIPSVPDFGILSIAVDPSYQETGIGGLLMEKGEDIAREREFRRMSLSVNPENHKAVSFYTSLGWYKFYKDGLWSGEMRKDLD